MVNLLKKPEKTWVEELDKLDQQTISNTTQVGSNLLARLDSNCRVTRRKAEQDLWMLRIMMIN